MEVSNPLSWANLGPWGLVAVLVAFIALGLLIPRPTLKDYRSDSAARIEEAKEAARQWREAHTLLMTKLEVLIEQNRALIESAKAQEQLLRNLPRARGGGEGDLVPPR